MDDALRTVRPIGIVIRAGIALAFIAISSLSHGQGSLAILDPTISGDTVTLPIHLQGYVLDGVAALDFQLTYDAAILQPVQVYLGEAAAKAGKKVQARVLEDGQYAVLMFGTERSAVTQGEVARITLNKISQPKDGQTPVTIIHTKFATVSSVEIPSQGSTATLLFDSETDEGNGDAGGLPPIIGGGTPNQPGQTDAPQNNDGPAPTPSIDGATKAGGANSFDLAGARAAVDERLSTLRGAQAEREAARAEIDRASGDKGREPGLMVRSASSASRVNSGDTPGIVRAEADRVAPADRGGAGPDREVRTASARIEADTRTRPTGADRIESPDVSGLSEGNASTSGNETTSESAVLGGVKAQAGVLAVCLAIALGVYVNRRRRGV